MRAISQRFKQPQSRLRLCRCRWRPIKDPSTSEEKGPPEHREGPKFIRQGRNHWWVRLAPVHLIHYQVSGVGAGFEGDSRQTLDPNPEDWLTASSGL